MLPLPWNHLEYLSQSTSRTTNYSLGNTCTFISSNWMMLKTWSFSSLWNETAHRGSSTNFYRMKQKLREKNAQNFIIVGMFWGQVKLFKKVPDEWYIFNSSRYFKKKKNPWIWKDLRFRISIIINVRRKMTEDDIFNVH